MIPIVIKAKLHGENLPKSLGVWALWAGALLAALIIGAVVGLVIGLVPFYKDNQETSHFSISIKSAGLIANTTLRSLIAASVANRQLLSTAELGRLQTINGNLSDQLNALLLPAFPPDVLKITDVLLLPDANSFDRVTINYSLFTIEVKKTRAGELENEIAKVKQSELISKSLVNPVNGRRDVIEGAIEIGAILSNK